MCGIFGYVGNESAPDIILEGLKNLEYRGYDSWGLSVSSKNKIHILKRKGKIGDVPKSYLSTLPKSSLGVGHTRWATHGRVNRINAHPHKAGNGRFSLVQNGIVQNFSDLKEKFFPFDDFKTQTDTEVIVKLIEKELEKNLSLVNAVRRAFLKLKGRNTIVLLDSQKERLIAVKKGSPLIIGLGENEIYLSSDSLSFAQFTNKIVPIDNWQMVEVFNGKLRLFDVLNGEEKPIKQSVINYRTKKISKEGMDSFYIKEVLEQPDTIREAVTYKNSEFKKLKDHIKKAKSIYTVGSGTASYAAAQCAYFLRTYPKIKCSELRAYETDSLPGVFQKNDLLIAFSQSGETADTIECVEQAKAKGVKVCSVVNMLGSSLERLSDFTFHSRSGPEISVVSTKAFTAQISWGLLLALSLSGKYGFAISEIEETSKKLKKLLSAKYVKDLQRIALKLVRHKSLYVLGKGQNYNIALEGALKIKEISYIHAEGFAAGELKHGVIALIEKGTPVVVVISDDDVKEDALNAAYEVKSRGAHVVGVSYEKKDVFDDTILVPRLKFTSSIANIIPIQLLGYFMTKEKGLSPDKPRNLAKSVTVK